MSSTTPPLARADGVELIEVEGKKWGRESLSPYFFKTRLAIFSKW